jgi:hypothetical protein
MAHPLYIYTYIFRVEQYAKQTNMTQVSRGTVCRSVIFRCISVIYAVYRTEGAYFVFVVTFVKCPINSITNPNPVYIHSKIMKIHIHETVITNKLFN